MISTAVVAVSVLMAERGLNEDEANDLHLAMLTMVGFSYLYPCHIGAK